MTTEEWRDSLLVHVRTLEADLKVLSERLTLLEIKSATDEVHRHNVETRLGSIEDTLKWLVRLIIGALIIAVVGFALGGGFILV